MNFSFVNLMKILSILFTLGSCHWSCLVSYLSHGHSQETKIMSIKKSTDPSLERKWRKKDNNKLILAVTYNPTSVSSFSSLYFYFQSWNCGHNIIVDITDLRQLMVEYWLSKYRFIIVFSLVSGFLFLVQY